MKSITIDLNVSDYESYEFWAKQTKEDQHRYLRLVRLWIVQAQGMGCVSSVGHLFVAEKALSALVKACKEHGKESGSSCCSSGVSEWGSCNACGEHTDEVCFECGTPCGK